MGTLYDIASEAAALLAACEERDLTDADREAFGSHLESLRDEASGSVDHYARCLRELDARGVARRAEAAALADMARRDEQSAARLRAFLLWALRSLGATEAKGTMFRLRRVANGGKLPIVLADGVDGETVPPRFRRVKVEVDKDALRDALEKGNKAARKYASIGERGESVRIA